MSGPEEQRTPPGGEPRPPVPMDRDRPSRVVPFAPELLPALRGFSERYWEGRPRTADYYDWRYLQPQAFSRMFLALQDEDCLGTLFALRKAYRIGGRPAACLEVFDWHSLPGLKGSGVGIRLMRAMMKQPEPVLSVGGTPDVLATLPAMKWERIGEALRYELHVSGELLARRIRRRAGVPVALSRPLLGALAALRAPRPHGAPPGGEVDVLDAPPAELAGLYEGETGHGFVQEPDPAVLRWMTGGRWSGRYRCLAFRVGGRLRGWALTRAHVTDLGREAALVEVFAPRPDVALYTWMVSVAAASLVDGRPLRINARASCPTLQAALLANRFRVTPPVVPIHLWPQGTWDRSGPLHVTLNHSDAALLPYLSGERVLPGAERP